MTEQTNLVPKRRFKEFQNTHTWEQRKVIDISEKTFGGGTPKTSIKEYWNGEIPWIQSSDIHEHQVSGVFPKKKISVEGLKNSATKLISKDSIAIVTRVGVGKIALMQFEYATSQDFLSLGNLRVNEWFGVYSLYNQLQKEVHNVQGTSIKGITKNELLDKKVNIPTSSEEQTMIGNFFKLLDNTINLQQRKLKKMEVLKSAYLSEMFPAEGEHEPKRRFAGFTQAWQQCKLGDITESYSGGTPNVGNKLYYGGNIPFIRSAEINSESTELFITEDGFNNSSAKMVEKGDILYALYGATSGEVGISKINGAINQAILAIKPKYGDDSYFITQWLKKQKNTIINTYLQGGQGNLSGSIVKDLTISLPTNKVEQVKIGDYFKQLDNLITLYQRKLEKLQNIKKAYLTEMFV